MKRVIQEIDRAEAEGQLGEFVTWKEAQKLPYLQACIKEALRKTISIIYVTNKLIL